MDEDELIQAHNEIYKEMCKHMNAAGTKNKPSEPPLCSFCGKTKYAAKVMVAGPAVNICDECVSICQAIINKELKIEH